MEPISDLPAPPKPDWALLLPRTAFFDIMRVLQAALPPPGLDEPAEWLRRDQAAMAAALVARPVVSVRKAGPVSSGRIGSRNRRVETTVRFYEPGFGEVVGDPSPQPPPTRDGGEVAA